MADRTRARDRHRMAETPAGRLGEPRRSNCEGGRVEPCPASAGRAQTSNGTLALDRMRQRKLPQPKTSAAEANMPAYFVAELDTTNQAGMEPYRAAVPATIAQYGGRYLTRGVATELIEGGPEPKRVVILEFADTAAVKRWYNSPEYQKILPMRLDYSTGRAFIVEGVS
jgi:uncharacterized protein (DUF1330 family)